jgi:hypothetical protein
MLLVHEHSTMEDASVHLLRYALDPDHWLPSEAATVLALRPAYHPADYHARVGKLRICACVNVRSNLDVVLHVAFRAPGLTPARAADHLEAFLGKRLPLLPNTEWQVEVDGRYWIHFQRTYLAQKLVA